MTRAQQIALYVVAAVAVASWVQSYRVARFIKYGNAGQQAALTA